MTDRAVLAARVSAPGCPVCLAVPNGSAARAARLRREPGDEVEPSLHPAGERIISRIAFRLDADEAVSPASEMGPAARHDRVCSSRLGNLHRLAERG